MKIKDLNKNYEKEIKANPGFVFNDKIKYTIKEGTKIKVLLDNPQTVYGEKLSGKHRKSDISWGIDDDYIVLNCIMLLNNPPLYKIKNLKTGEIPNTLYTK